MSATDLKECAICLEKMLDIDPITGRIVPTLTTECGHSFHFACVQTHVAANPTAPSCPLCRALWPSLVQLPAAPPRQPRLISQLPSRPHPPSNSYNLSSPSLDYVPRAAPVMHADSDDPVVAWTPSKDASPASEAVEIVLSGKTDPLAIPHNAAATVTALVTVKTVNKADITTSGDVSVAAGAPSAAATLSRAPLDLALVLDVSGSMSGEKIALLRETVLLVLTLLTPADRVCIITFNSAATARTPFRRCEGGGLHALRGVATSLSAGGGTSISSALREADAMLRRRSSRNPVTGVLLLSDGQSSDGDASQAAARSIVAQGAVVHTFGFGHDHDAAMMNGIAVEGGGNFTFIERYDTIRESFAACIGSLTDIVAQSMKLRLTAAAGVTIGRVYSAYPFTENAEHTSCELTLGELCDGERRDILVALSIPALTAPGAAPISVLDVALSYTRPNASAGSHAATVVTIDRPAAEALPADAVVRDVEVDLHKNRVAATAAMTEALASATSGRYDAVQRVLKEAQDTIRASVSAGEDVSEALLEDLQACATRLSSRETDAHGGRNYVMQAATSHSRQKAFYTPGSSNAAMWCGRKSMSVSDDVYATRGASEISADCVASPASSAMPRAMQKMAAKKKAGGDMCSPAVDLRSFSSPAVATPPKAPIDVLHMFSPESVSAPIAPLPAVTGASLLPPPHPVIPARRTARTVPTSPTISPVAEVADSPM